MATTADVTRWMTRVEVMLRCRATTDLIVAHGRPGHIERHEAFDIWHYPLGAIDGMGYSIHVTVIGDQVAQVYMHTAPMPVPPAPPRRPR